MRRLAAVLLVAITALAAAAAGVLAASPQRGRLHDFVCKRALDPSQREVSVTAMMRPLPGTRHMALKFDLLDRSKQSITSSSVSGGDLGKWISPQDPTLGQKAGDKWVVPHPVVGLAAPAYYRFRVSFRWSGHHGHVIARRQRSTQECFQPELRPDLLVVSIQVKPIQGQSNNDRYIATIANHGKTAAGPFEVYFSYGAVTVKRSLSGLAANASTKQTFTGPLCTVNTAPTVTVDPTHQVDDYNTQNNSMVANCSGAGGG